jgi:hypothetical protein
VTCRPGTSVLVLVIETQLCPHTPRPADEDGLPTSPVELTYARASPTFGQFNRPSGRVADRRRCPLFCPYYVVDVSYNLLISFINLEMSGFLSLPRAYRTRRSAADGSTLIS